VASTSLDRPSGGTSTTLDAAQRKLRSEIANAVREGRSEDAAALRRDYELSKIEAAVRRVVAAAPPLTEQQHARLAQILLAAPAPG